MHRGILKRESDKLKRERQAQVPALPPSTSSLHLKCVPHPPDKTRRLVPTRMAVIHGQSAVLNRNCMNRPVRSPEPTQGNSGVFSTVLTCNQAPLGSLSRGPRDDYIAQIIAR